MVPRRAVVKIGLDPTASRTGEGLMSSDTRAQQAMRMMAVSGPIDSFLMRIAKIRRSREGPPVSNFWFTRQVTGPVRPSGMVLVMSAGHAGGVVNQDGSARSWPRSYRCIVEQAWLDRD